MVPFYFIQKKEKFQKVIYTDDNFLYDGYNTGPGVREGTDT
jgi:hypothetical protein